MKNNLSQHFYSILKMKNKSQSQLLIFTASNYELDDLEARLYIDDKLVTTDLMPLFEALNIDWELIKKLQLMQPYEDTES